MTPRELNIWRTDHGYSQEELAARLDIAANTIARWETSQREIPGILPLALKGLAFTHGKLCNCPLCYRLYPRAPRKRDVRETRPTGIKRAEPAPPVSQEAV